MDNILQETTCGLDLNFAHHLQDLTLHMRIMQHALGGFAKKTKTMFAIQVAMTKELTMLTSSINAKDFVEMILNAAILLIMVQEVPQINDKTIKL